MLPSFGHSERNHKFTKGQNLQWHALEMSLWSFKDANVHIALTLVAVFIRCNRRSVRRESGDSSINVADGDNADISRPSGESELSEKPWLGGEAKSASGLSNT